MNKAAVTLATVLAVLTSCRPGHNDTSEYRFLPEKSWNYGDTLIFEPEIADSVATGCLTLSLRHTNDYLYSNLWLETVIVDSIGSLTDTLHIRLADDFGRWLGRGIGTDYQMTDTIAPSIRLHRPVKVKVRHIMRADRLDDIEQVGIAFTQ